MIYNSNFSILLETSMNSPVSFLFSGIHWRAPDGTCYPLDFGIPHLDGRWRWSWSNGPTGGGFMGTNGVANSFFLKTVWYLAVGFCSSNLGPGETFWNMERWWVCLLKVGGNFWSGLPAPNQPKQRFHTCRMIILRRCEPTNVRWDHLGLGKCSRRLRFVGVSWCHQSVSRFFKILFLQTPKLKWSNSSEFRSTKILINLWPFSVFEVDLWLMIPEVSGGLFVSINFRPCSFGSLQLRHWRCWFMSPTQNMSPASSTRQSQEILR